MDEWINNLWFLCTMGYYSALKRKEILTRATAWKKLEDIMLSETNQSPKRNTLWLCIYDVHRFEFRKQKVKSCPTLCKSMNYSLPGSSVHGTFQVRILKWVAMPFLTQGSNLAVLYLLHWQAGSLSLVPPGIPTEHKGRRWSPEREGWEEEQGVIVNGVQSFSLGWWKSSAGG